MTPRIRCSRRLTVLNRFGICARPAALVVRVTTRYPDTDVEFRTDDGQTASGRSIMGLLTLEGYQGRELLVVAEGPDAKACIEDLTRVFDGGFGMDGKNLPVPSAHAEWVEYPPEPGPSEGGT